MGQIILCENKNCKQILFRNDFTKHYCSQERIGIFKFMEIGINSIFKVYVLLFYFVISFQGLVLVLLSTGRHTFTTFLSLK